MNSVVCFAVHGEVQRIPPSSLHRSHTHTKLCSLHYLYPPLLSSDLYIIFMLSKFYMLFYMLWVLAELTLPRNLSTYNHARGHFNTQLCSTGLWFH